MLKSIPVELSDTLHQGQTLNAGQELKSANGEHRLAMQEDGNLVVYRMFVVSPTLLSKIHRFSCPLARDRKSQASGVNSYGNF